jgi:hypothetical protein
LIWESFVQLNEASMVAADNQAITALRHEFNRTLI